MSQHPPLCLAIALISSFSLFGAAMADDTSKPSTKPAESQPKETKPKDATPEKPQDPIELDDEGEAFFADYDTNKDGVVTMQELTDAIAKKSADLEKEMNSDTSTTATQKGIIRAVMGGMAKIAMEEWDTNKDGQITRGERAALLEKHEQERIKKAISWFNAYDADKDGKVTCQEFEDKLKANGQSAKYLESLVDSMLDSDADNDRAVSLEEVKADPDFFSKVWDRDVANRKKKAPPQKPGAGKTAPPPPSKPAPKPEAGPEAPMPDKK